MYLLKISKDGQILAVQHYKHFENAVAAISDYSLFDLIPDEVINQMGEWGVPRISCHGINNETGISDDFEFKYPCGILIYVGRILFEEDKQIK
jgi:hypothetical protein